MIKEYKKGDSLQLSPNFNLFEFHCHCNYPECQITYVDTDITDYLQAKRDELKIPIRVSCGFRCHRHNKDVGGKPGSFHLIGKAADITTPDCNINGMANEFEDADGLGRYPTKGFIHVDRRGYKSRWIG